MESRTELSRTDLGGGVRRHHPGSALPGSEIDLSAPLTGQELTSACLCRARELGFVRAGVASLDPFDSQAVGLEAFLAHGYGGTMEYLARRGAGGQLERRTPEDLLPGALCAISVALPYIAPETATVRLRRSQKNISVQGEVASYARGVDYHLIIKERLLLLADQIADLAGKSIVARACVDTAPLFERDLAVRAGYAFVGKNTLGIAPGAGSHFLLGELLLDVKLECNAVPISDGCGSCSLCLDCCPTSAFVGPYKLDARSCISYLTIESREDIPRELRHQLTDKVFGCDDCQSVCPYNQAGHKRVSAPQLEPLPHLSAPDLVPLLTMGASKYRKFVAKTALRRVTRDQLARNVAVALGNSGSSEAVEPLLQSARSHRSTQVRVHCTWALGHLGGVHEIPAARDAVQTLCEDACEAVADEARRWIAGATSAVNPGEA